MRAKRDMVKSMRRLKKRLYMLGIPKVREGLGVRDEVRAIGCWLLAIEKTIIYRTRIQAKG